MSVKCAGQTKLETLINNKVFDVTVKNVLYAPDLTTNLLSVSQLIKNDNRVSFEADGCKIFNRNGLLIGVARLINGEYRL